MKSKQLVEEMLTAKQSALNAMSTLHNDEIERMTTTHLSQLSILKSDLSQEKQECQTLQETITDLQLYQKDTEAKLNEGRRNLRDLLEKTKENEVLCG